MIIAMYCAIVPVLYNSKYLCVINVVNADNEINVDKNNKSAQYDNLDMNEVRIIVPVG